MSERLSELKQIVTSFDLDVVWMMLRLDVTPLSLA